MKTKITIILFAIVCLLAPAAFASEAGMQWDEASGAEGYYVYWRSPSSTFVVVDSIHYPVCGGYYDTTPPSLAPGVSCVDRTAPFINVTGLPDSPPVLILAVKATNEIGLSPSYSNEVRKHNMGADPTGNARRSEPPPLAGP
jgi:hypothetical protein